MILFFSTSSFIYADTFESYGFDTSKGNTNVLLGMKNDQIIYEKYSNGYDFKRPHILHSVNKIFLNAFLGNLEKEGLISINSPIDKLIHNTYSSKITIDSLMRMSSGMRAISDFESMDIVYPGLIRPTEEIPNNFFDFYLLKSLPMYAPDTHFNYGFHDNNLLILHLENIFGRYALKSMFMNFLLKFNFFDTKISIKEPEQFLFERYDSFLNKQILLNNTVDMFSIPPSLQFGSSSAKDILELAKLYLKRKNDVFSLKWRNDSLSCRPENFIESRTKQSFFAPYTYGRYWFLNLPHTNGQKPYPKLPSDLAIIYGLKGQVLAIFPSQNAIYLRLAKDTKNSKFDSEKHLNLFYDKFLKTN